ncbi:extracellular solute-binding protein [Agrobacterium tumefaciens]|uniref:ABC transporter substrate-binding protein n=1 Tax=Agrobacterium tumefaciens TaxID=358 RepID=A0A2L2LMQ7_AGRTU|nr:extracellular solute-binding protein [Agrobacterium tumefaciens]AVH45576.1 hypothetical protein At1D1609_55460 [Agrobacterium tumefaciens]NSY99370.1 extracellular solute-binding protein [Agrobacterium tumefaciens]
MKLTRRQVTHGMAVAAVGSAVTGLSMRPSRAAAKEIIIAQSGGQAGEALEKAYVAPFTAKTGVPVRLVGVESSTGELKAMLQSGTIDRHIWDVELADILSSPDLFEELDWDAIAPEPIFPEARQPKGIGRHYYSYVMSWNSKAKPIETWADFFDTEKFPGRRAMMSYDAYAQLEVALLADGVPADQLYPLNVDRAFRFLEANKDKINIWWDSGSQAAQVVTSGEVDYALIYSGRVAYSKEAGMTYNQGISVLNYLAVTKGIDPETKTAVMQFFHEMTVPRNELAAVQTIAYSGPSQGLDALLNDEQRHALSSSAQNRQKQILINSAWWAENRSAIDKRWTEFRASL